MATTWDHKIEQFWATVEAQHPGAALAAMQSLVAERPDGDPEALYELASIHDYLGLEHQAVPLYRAALDHGLSGPRRSQAIIQLASSLRNIGEPHEAIHLLREHPSDELAA